MTTDGIEIQVDGYWYRIVDLPVAFPLEDQTQKAWAKFRRDWAAERYAYAFAFWSTVDLTRITRRKDIFK